MQYNFRTPLIRFSALAGLALFVLLVFEQGISDLVAALASAGAGLLVLAAYHLLTMSADAAALHRLIRTGTRLPWSAVLHARWLQESVNNLLPVMQIGGNLVKARTLMRRGVHAELAGAVVVADVTLTVLTQILFTLCGLFLLLLHLGGGDIARSAAVGVVLMGLMLGGFYYVQRRGLFSGIMSVCRRIARGRDFTALSGNAADMDARLLSLYRNRVALAGAASRHMLAWFVGIGEVWLALYFLGYPVGLLEATLLESLGRAVRAAAFAVPGALGVQEGAFLLLGGLVGLPATASLSLSLSKRVRELLLGLPGLFAWQLDGARHLLDRQGLENRAP